MVIIPEFMDIAGISRLEQLPVHYDPALYRDRRQLMALMPQADGLIVRNQTRVDRQLLDGADRLRVIGRLGVGLDNIDQALLRERGIRLVVPRGANAVSVAEYVMAAMLTVSRRIEHYTGEIRSAIWDRSIISFELAGKTLGLIGFGATGQAVARRALGFDMRVVAYDSHQTRWMAGVDRAESWQDMLADLDFLSLHVPETDETHMLVNEDFLSRLPARCILINTARGGIVDETALAAFLEARRIRGAVLDVRRTEPPLADPHDPLMRLTNVWCTPHVAGLTKESQVAIAVMVADQVGQWLRN